MSDRTTMVAVPGHLVARLADLSRRSGRSVASYVSEAIYLSIQDFEDEYDASLVIANLEAGRETTRPLADVERELGLNDDPDV